MKDIPTEELSAISVEIYEAAVRVGCTHVSVTGQIWPGGQISGVPGEAARFVEFSWLRAAVINGRAIFEETDPKAYKALLVAYGLEDEPNPELTLKASEQDEVPAVVVPVTSEKIELTVEVLLATKHELDRQATAAGLSVGEFLDWKFPPRPVFGGEPLSF